MKGFTILSKAGEDTYDYFYLGKNKKTGESVIIRKYSKNDEILTKIQTLKSLHCPNVPLLTDVFSTEKVVNLVFTLGKSQYKILDQYMHRKGLDSSIVQVYAYQLLSGLAYIHGCGLTHCDIRPSNCFIDRANNLKIARIEDSFRTLPGFVQYWYQAPELLCGSTQYDSAADVWSAGCTIAEMVTGNVLFYACSKKEQLTKIFKVLGTPNEEGNRSDFIAIKKQELKSTLKTEDSLLIDLLLKLLEVNPSNRITASDALNHQYFDTILNQHTMNP